MLTFKMTFLEPSQMFILSPLQISCLYPALKRSQEIRPLTPLTLPMYLIIEDILLYVYSNYGPALALFAVLRF